MLTSRLRTIFITLITIMIFLACRLPGSPAESSSPPATEKAAAVAPATTAEKKEAPAPTKTTAPAAAPTDTAVPPAPTQPDTTTAMNAGTARLEFIPWSTSVYTSSDIKSGEVKKYLVNAMKGQLMMVSVDSQGNDVVFDLAGVSSGGTIAKSVKTLDYRLTATQDYLISVKAAGGDTNFGLNITVPANITFKPGSDSATLKGHIQEASINTYLARAGEGQTMTVKLTSPSGDVLLTIYGYQDGSPLVRHVSGATEWSGKLPATQDYVIQAISVGSETDYSIKVTIQ